MRWKCVTLSSVPLMVAVNNDVPAKTLKEFVELAKAKPGQVSFAYASTSQQVSSEMLSSMAGIKMNAIPYKSGPNAMTDLIGGQVMMFTADFAVTVPQHGLGEEMTLVFGIAHWMVNRIW